MFITHTCDHCFYTNKHNILCRVMNTWRPGTIQDQSHERFRVKLQYHDHICKKEVLQWHTTWL